MLLKFFYLVRCVQSDVKGVFDLSKNAEKSAKVDYRNTLYAARNDTNVPQTIPDCRVKGFGVVKQ